MCSRCDGKRTNLEDDRLFSLPDDLIHKILSFIDIKQAIKTSVLSSRWRYIWTSVPCLNFSDKDYHTIAELSKFVTSVMSRRNNQIEVSSVKFTFYGKLSEVFIRIINIILKYESSHNIQHLDIIINGPNGEKIEPPLSIFSSQSLKHLTLTGCTYKHPITTTPTWEMPALTTLNLHPVTFEDKCFGLFSNFANLKNLTLRNCQLSNGFNICHHGLSDLTLDDGYYVHGVVKVVTPQLKNLTIINWLRIHLVSSPDLVSLRYKYDSYSCFYRSLKVSTNLNLEKVDVCISHSVENMANAHKVVRLLQQLRSVKFLTLNMEIIKLLSSSKLISPLPSPFNNIKILKISPAHVTLEIKSYLQDSSPGTTFTTASLEEVRVVMNVAQASILMRELQVLLDQWKEIYNKTNTAHLMQDIVTVPEQVEDENLQDMKMKWRFGERMTHIKRYWKGLSEQLEEGYKNTSRVTSKLHEIEGVLTKLPTSERAKLQAVMEDMIRSQFLQKPTLMDLQHHNYFLEKL